MENLMPDQIEPEDTNTAVESDIKPVPLVRPSSPIKTSVPIPVSIEEIYSTLPEPAGPAVVGLGEVDDVYLSSCVYKNLHSRKSLTVHHLQRRLVELGYVEAARDRDGYYGDLTKYAIAKFQAANGINGDGSIDSETFQLIFKGDPNVRLND
jgi:peptidoglycan hydrolase-like protein with peptidoglycan-binding domain